MDEMLWDEMTGFVESEVTCRLGLACDGKPYVVPLSYVFMDGAFFIHLVGGHGKKARLIENNPQVCIEVDSYSPDHLSRRSAIATGKAERVTDKATLAKFLEKLAAKYPHFSPGGIGRHPKIARPFLKLSVSFMADKITVYKIVPETITGRKSDDTTTKP